jgi:hypothetical protein
VSTVLDSVGSPVGLRGGPVSVDVVLVLVELLSPGSLDELVLEDDVLEVVF